MARVCLWAALIVACALDPKRVAAQQHTAQPAAIACTPDPQLTEAAAELLLAHLHRPSAQALAEAVRDAGSDAVGLHALFVPAGSKPGTEATWLATLRSRVDGQLFCGRADNEAGRLIIGLGRGAALEPIDAHARIVRGQLQPGFGDAEIVIQDGAAQLLRVGVTAESLRKGIELAPELQLPLKIQLVAHGPTGPRPVAERELQTDAQSGSASADEDQRIGSFDGAAIDAESRNAAASSVHDPRNDRADSQLKPSAPAADGGAKAFSDLVLKLRASRGRHGLRSNRLLSEAAKQHAEEVCAKGRVAHEVEAGAGPDARLAKAGLDARLLGEAIARAEDTDSALHALRNSPSHLYTLLDPRFTDFGIGVAKDQAEKFCYVVLLCAWPRYVGKRQ